LTPFLWSFLFSSGPADHCFDYLMSFFGVGQGLFTFGGYFLRILIGVDWVLDTPIPSRLFSDQALGT
jgi:hypothetical protein